MQEDKLREIIKELPPHVSLVAVSKFHPSGAVLQAYDAGQRLFGESRPQELRQKALELPSDIRWHFIGHLQTNKLKMVLPYVEMVESVDSERLLEAIRKWAVENGRRVDVLLEVHIASEESKQGFSEAELPAVLGKDWGPVRLRGLMGMASNTPDETIVRREFARISELFAGIRRDYPSLETFDCLSIGMSSDWRIALEYGATIVRIGTAIFGERKYV